MKMYTIFNSRLMETVLGIVSINLGGDEFLENLIDFDIRGVLLVDRDDFLLGKLDLGEFIIDIENVG